MNVVFPTSSFSKVRFIALCHLLRREEKQEQHNAYLLLRTIFERAVETSFKNNYRTSSWKLFTSLNGALKHSSKYHPFFSKFFSLSPGTRVGELAAGSCDVASVLECDTERQKNLVDYLSGDTERQKNLVDYLSGGTCSRCWNFAVVSEDLFSISHILLAGLFWLLLLALSSFSVNSVPAIERNGCTIEMPVP